MEFTPDRISAIVKRMRQGRREHDARLRVRRMFLEMAADAYVEGNGTGTNIPEPFDKSRLTFKVLVGEVAKGAIQYAAMTAANAPTVTVPPVAIDRPDVTQTVDKRAAEQERLLSTLWETAGGRRKQWQVSYSQSWGRVGWYFTLPRDRAWGMPDRAYYEDLTDDEIEGLKASGRVTPEPIRNAEGVLSYAETGEAYLERRKRSAQQSAISARSLFVLDAYPPDVVYAESDADGVKWAAAVLEVPAYDCGPGSDYAKGAHRLSGTQEDVSQYGLYNDHGMIRGGVTRGGEPGVHSGTTWTYTIFGTRSEVYCLVSSTPESVGTLVWYAEHDLGDCPFVPVPGYYTDSTRPGGEYSSPMEAVFAKAPLLSQLETLLALVAGYNATARWVIILPDGKVQLLDEQSGEPISVGTAAAIGSQPKQTEIVAGQPFLLTLDADLLFQLVGFYSDLLRLDLPSDAATGNEGASGTAWALRQMIEQQLTLLQQPVDNHADGVQGIMRRWMHCMREANNRGELETVYAFALPGKKRDRRAVRGLIEFDPAHLIDSIVVNQSSDTAQAKIVKDQVGIEKLAAGTVTMRDYLEYYADEPDARQAEIELVAYDLQRFALYGDSTKLVPGSVLHDFALALRGRISQRLFELAPAYAIATAESMATDALAQFEASQQPAAGAVPGEQGNVAEAAGLRQPGVGMAEEQVGEPGGGQIPPVAPVPGGGTA